MNTKISFILLFSFMMTIVHGQSTVDTIPPYKKDKHIPAFDIQLVDSSFFNKAKLPKNKRYTVIVYFSPDCSHCQHEAKEMVKKMDSLTHVNFVWASYKPMAEIEEFYHKYKLDQYKNNFVGRDAEYRIPSFFRVRFTPFVAVYDKKGLLVKAFDGGVEMEELMPLLK